MGQGLRFVQEYFPRRLLARGPRAALPPAATRLERAPRQGRHPAQRHPPGLAVPELMRILLDEARLGWDQPGTSPGGRSPTRTTRSCPRRWRNGPCGGSRCCCRATWRSSSRSTAASLEEVRARFPGDEGRVERVSLVEEGGERKIRMANLAIVGSHSTNGVAAIHSELLRTVTVRDLAELFPERFSNKTNGVTPRRWLLLANPALARCITEAIGDGWITDLAELAKLKPLADDAGFRDAVRKAKREAKARFAEWLKSTSGRDRRSGLDLRQPGQAHPRVQAAAAERAARGGALRPAAAEPGPRDGAAHVLLRRQGGAGLSPGQAHHQVPQQPGRHHRRRPGGARPPQGRVPARVLRVPGRAADPRHRCLQPDLDRGLRGERHEQHEVHDERGA